MLWRMRARDVVNAMAEVSISGTNKPYPPLNSVAKKMAVSGACSTPAIMPHKPAKTALPMGMAVGLIQPLTPSANAKPTKAPANNAGAKMPATPPAPTVNPVSMGLRQAASNNQPNRLGKAKEPSSIHMSSINTSE